MLNIINTTFSSIEVWFTDQSSEPLDVEDSVKITLIIDIIKMRCSVESNIKNVPKDMAFNHLQKNMEINMVKN